MRETEYTCRILVETPLGKQPLARPRRWKDKIKKDFREIFVRVRGWWNWLRVMHYGWV
jgi:hypothetical protein